jgi:hypothetical protein
MTERDVLQGKDETSCVSHNFSCIMLLEINCFHGGGNIKNKNYALKIYSFNNELCENKDKQRYVCVSMCMWRQAD